MINAANRIQEINEYYFSKKLKQIAELQNKGYDIINLGIGRPDMAPSKKSIDELKHSASDPNNHSYQSYSGIQELRDAFANWYEKYFKVTLNPRGEILPLMGSKEGIMHLSMAFLNPGDGVLIPNPGYPTYASVSKLLDADIIYYDLLEENQWQPDIESLERLDLTNVKLMWVNYPNMPTGKRASIDLFQRLVDFGIKHKILICNDNPYSFILNEEQISILAASGAMDIAMELNSLSKSHNLSGWRVGMLAGNESYIANVLRVKSNMDSGMFLPVQQAAVKALNIEGYWYNQINKEYASRRKVVYSILDFLECTYDREQTGMFVWAKLPCYLGSSEEFSELILKNANVFITPGFIFGSNGSRYIRISLCSNEELLLKSLNRIKEKIKIKNINR